MATPKRSLFGKALGSTKNYTTRNKSMYAVKEVIPGQEGERVGTACAVKDKTGYYLVTWCQVGQDGAQAVTADRYQGRKAKHSINIDNPVEDNGLSYIPLKCKPEKYLKLIDQKLSQEDLQRLQAGFSAHTFIEGDVVQLEFKWNRRKLEYDLIKIEPKQSELQQHLEYAVGAPIIVELGTGWKDTVVGVLGLSASDELVPVFHKEAGIDLKEQTRIRESLHQEKPQAEGMHSEFDLPKVRGQLAEFYQTTMSQVQMAPWDPNDTVHIDKVYTRLSWCREDKHPSGTEEAELGDYADIFHGHKNYPNHKKIVVEGLGGIGKSTFSQKLAVDWARGEKEALKKFDLLLVIKLRDVGRIRNFKEMLVASGIVQSEECAQVESFVQYMNEHQEKVLILFDGYDEYDRELAQDVTSDVHKIITGKMLIGCHLVVTTRSQRVGEVKKYMHTQCKIKGFTEEDIKKFASKYVGNEEVTPFIRYLWQQDIVGMAEIPLMLLFLCLLWKERRAEPLPTSRTQLYQEFVQCILDHCFARVSPDNLKSIDECSETLCKIGKVAFEALLRDSLVFDSAQLPREVLSDEAVRLGFLSTSKAQHGRSKLMASFFHKSVQEFLAAWYITKEAIPRGFNDFLSPICDFATFKGLEDFLSFVCGLSTEAANAVFAHLKNIVKKEDLVPSCSSLSYCVDFTQNQRDFSEWCSEFFSGLDHKEDIAAAYLDCVDGVVVFQEIIPQDWRQLLPVLSVLLHHENLIQLQLPALRDWTLDLGGSPTEAKFLTALGGVCSVLDEVDVRVVTCTSGKSCMTGSEFMKDMISQNNFECIFWLFRKGPVFYLYPTNLSISTLDNFDWFFDQFLPPAADQSGSQAQASEHDASEDVRPCHVLSLTKHLKIYRIHDRLVEVLCLLKYAINISGLTLEDLGMSEREAAVLLANLQNHDVGSVVRRALSECLSSVPLLASLNLTDTKMGEKEVIDLAKVLKNVSQLKMLDLSGNHLGPAVSVLSKCLSLVPQLVSLNLADTKIGEKEIKALAKALKNVPQLQMLRLDDNRLGPGVSVLACHLQSVPNLVELDLQKTSMTEKEAADLAKALQHVPLLRELRLSENPIGCGLIPLAENLVHVPQLRSLMLDKTNMTEREATDLAIALQHVPLLEELYLDGNPLGHGVITLAQAVIHAVPELSILSLCHTDMDAECGAALKRAQQHRFLLVGDGDIFDDDQWDEWGEYDEYDQ